MQTTEEPTNETGSSEAVSVTIFAASDAADTWRRARLLKTALDRDERITVELIDKLTGDLDLFHRMIAARAIDVPTIVVAGNVAWVGELPTVAEVSTLVEMLQCH